MVSTPAPPSQAETPAGARPGGSTFGPTALWTPANVVSVLRMCGAAALVALLIADRRWAAFGVGALLALSDNLDGFLARRQGTTRSGAFLDPLADKVLVGAALVTLAFKGDVSWIPVAALLSREVVISAFRSYAARRGATVPASIWGKVKTFVSDWSAGLIIAPVVGLQQAGRALLWVAVAVAWLSALDYLVRAGQLLREGQEGARAG